MGVEISDDGTVTITPELEPPRPDDVSRETLEIANEALETANESVASTQEIMELCRMQSQQISELTALQTSLSSDLASIQAKLSEMRPLIEASIDMAKSSTPDMETGSEILEASPPETISQEPTLVLAETATDTSEILTDQSNSTETEAPVESGEDQKGTLLVEPVAPHKARVMMY